MAFTDVAPPETWTNKTGISFSLSAPGKKKTATVRLSFTAVAQEEIFGGPIDGKRFFAKAGRAQDEGRLLLTEHDEGDLVAAKSMHGSANIKMKAWDLLPKSKRPAAAIDLVGPQEGGFVFQLPTWARPNGVGGKMTEEYGLKPSKKPA